MITTKVPEQLRWVEDVQKEIEKKIPRGLQSVTIYVDGSSLFYSTKMDPVFCAFVMHKTAMMLLGSLSSGEVPADMSKRGGFCAPGVPDDEGKH